MKRKTDHKFNFLLVVFSLFLAVFQLYLLNSESTSGETLRTINVKISEIEDQNTILSREVASASAIAVIAQKARESGFSTGKNMLSMDMPLPVAYSEGSNF